MSESGWFAARPSGTEDVYKTPRRKLPRLRPPVPDPATKPAPSSPPPWEKRFSNRWPRVRVKCRCWAACVSKKSSSNGRRHFIRARLPASLRTAALKRHADRNNRRPLLQESFHNGREPTLYPPHDFPQSPHNPDEILLHPNPAASANNRCISSAIERTALFRRHPQERLSQSPSIRPPAWPLRAFGRRRTQLDPRPPRAPSTPTKNSTPLQIITGYNNYYEFGTSKDEPAKNAKNFKTSPWTVTVEGEVAKPLTFDHRRAA